MADEVEVPLPKWLADTPIDGKVHVSPGGIGFIRIRPRPEGSK